MYVGTMYYIGLLTLLDVSQLAFTAKCSAEKKKSAPHDWSVAGGETDEKYGVRKHQNDQGFDGHTLTDGGLTEFSTSSWLYLFIWNNQK